MWPHLNDALDLKICSSNQPDLAWLVSGIGLNLSPMKSPIKLELPKREEGGGGEVVSSPGHACISSIEPGFWPTSTAVQKILLVVCHLLFSLN